MSEQDAGWEEGTIKRFQGAQAGDRAKMKKPGQVWADMAYFPLSMASQAGYTDEELEEGRTLQYRSTKGPKGPIVAEFRPAAEVRKEAPPPPPPQDEGLIRPPRAWTGPQFHNPYHFYPVVRPSPQDVTTHTGERVFDPHAGAIHDRFLSAAQGFYSGRIVAQIVTEGPMVVGAGQSKAKDGATVVEPFELPHPRTGEMRPAIPGTSLRGAVGAVLEAATASALRVLDERKYTQRADHKRASLGAIGMIRQVGDVKKLLPLTYGPDEIKRNGLERDRCRHYLNGYKYDHGAGRHTPFGFLASKPNGFSHSNQEYWYADLTSSHEHGRGHFRLGFMLQGQPIPEAKYQSLSKAEQGKYTRGVLLVLGIDEPKDANLPPGKTHESFLPYPVARETEPLLDIPPTVLAEFEANLEDAEQLARGEKAKGKYPFLHRGRKRKPLGPRDGDLVYFKLQGGKVERIAYSSIWREAVRGGSLREAIREIDRNLTPFDSTRLDGEKYQLTLGERLLGFVQADGTRALASRLRFAHALCAEDRPPANLYVTPKADIVLPILASPKPPSPALYFGGRGYLAKHDLDLAKHKPQGRKAYLHHKPEEVNNVVQGRRHYESMAPDKDLDQKNRVRPVAKGVRYVFHIDFYNLSQRELESLAYALRPSDAFRYKLGMGKPLGLGTVRLEPLAICYRDRHRCYAPGSLFGAKYRAVHTAAAVPPEIQDALDARYPNESFAATIPEGETWPDLTTLTTTHAEWLQGYAPQVKVAIESLGDPGKLTHEVRYPAVKGQPREGEHFKWFVANDKLPSEQAAAMYRIDKDGKLPTLPIHNG